jgi:oxygen-dependent protoporphyrinogen oxidase
MSSNFPRLDTVVIGGGVSGLATAVRLKRAGHTTMVLEKQKRTGGSVVSSLKNGFLVDYGPNSTLETSPEIRKFVDDLGLSGRRVYANDSAGNRYIVRNGQLQSLPMNPPQFLKSQLFSWRAKLRLLAEPFIAPAPQDREETIAAFVKRRLGQEFLDYAINPFIAGVYAGDPEKLSVRSAVAKIYALEKNYGSLIKGAIRGARERKKRSDVDKTKAKLFSFQNGMQELISAMDRELGESVKLQAEINNLAPVEDGWRVECSINGESIALETVSVIFTAPAHATAGLLQHLDQSLASQLNAISYPPVAMVFLGYSNDVSCRPLDGFGFLIPKVENRRILGTIWSSTLFPDRAPEGGIALTTFVGGMRQPELAALDDEELTDLVTGELKELLDLQAKPGFVEVKKWPKAIPQYELGHQDKLDAVEKFEIEHPGLYLSGNFRGGISVGDCILRSAEVAGTVSEYCRKVQKQEAV